MAARMLVCRELSPGDIAPIRIVADVGQVFNLSARVRKGPGMFSHRARVIALCVPLFLGSSEAAAQEAPLQGLDEYIAKAMKEWEVPGLSLAVVKDDKVVLSKGYGVRKLGETAPVDAQTIFAIGSCTKAFTATALAML